MILDAESVGARSRMRNRLTAMRVLGGKCAGYDNANGCPWKVTDPRALQFDHVNGLNGKKREPHHKMYYNIIHHRAESGYYQLLCANCNYIKKYECGESFRGHGGEASRQFRLQREEENRNNPHRRPRKLRWPCGMNGLPIEGIDMENLCYMIAEEREIDPTTIPDHKIHEDDRIRFNIPYGFIRPKSGDKYLSPIAHFHSPNQ